MCTKFQVNCECDRGEYLKEEDDNEYDPAIYDDDDNGSADDINSRTKMKGEETAASA